jgi:hypothetical protein
MKAHGGSSKCIVPLIINVTNREVKCPPSPSGHFIPAKVPDVPTEQEEA